MPKVTCPSCQRTLTIAEATSKAIRCPKCSTAFRMNGPAPTCAATGDEASPRRPRDKAEEKPGRGAELTTDRPRRAADPDARRARRQVEEEIEEEEDADEPPRPRRAASVKARRTRQDEDEDEDEDEEEDEDEKEQLRPARKGKRKRKSVPLFQQPAFLIGSAVMLLLLMGGLGVGVYFLVSKDDSPSSPTDKKKDKDAGAYEIKFRPDTKGDKRLVIKEENVESTMPTIPGQAPGAKLVINHTVRYVEEILEKEENGPPTRIRRAYDRVQQNVGGVITSQGIEAKTIIIEKNGKGYTYLIEKTQQPVGQDAVLLDAEFMHLDAAAAREKVFLPGKPVAVGETWKIDTDPLLKEAGSVGAIQLDMAKGTNEAKLTRVHKKNGKTFGVFEIKLDYPILSIGKGAELMAFKSNAHLTVTVVRDCCIDGTSSEFSMRTTAVVAGTATVRGITAPIEICAIATESMEEQPH